MEETHALLFTDITQIRNKLVPNEIANVKLEMGLKVQHVEERLSHQIAEVWELVDQYKHEVVVFNSKLHTCLTAFKRLKADWLVF